MSEEHEPSLRAGYALAAITVLIWASFVVISRLGGKSVLTPFDITALRLGVAGIILFPWLIRRGLPSLSWKQIVVLMLCVGWGYPLLSYSGFALAPASHGAVLLSGALPFETALLSVVLLGERMSPSRLGALVFIACGIALIGVEGLAGERGPHAWIGDVLFLCASTSWALFTVLLKRWRVRALDVTLTVNVAAAVLYLPIYALFLPKQIAQAPTAVILTQGFFQGVIVVCVAMITFIKATEALGPARISMLMSLVPGLGALMAVPVVGEPLTQQVLVGIALVTIGALFGALAKAPRPLSAEPIAQPPAPSAGPQADVSPDGARRT